MIFFSPFSPSRLAVRTLVPSLAATLAGIGLVGVAAAPAHADPGDLTEIECIANAGAGGCVDPALDSLKEARGVVASPDGLNVYVAGFGGDSITTFDRASATGQLTQTGCIADAGLNGCTDPALDSLDGATGVAVSPDGKHIYVTGSLADSITIFDRNAGTGALTQTACLANTTVGGCTALANASLDGAWGVIVSPDGENVYVASQSGYSVTIFDRNSSTGALTEAGCIANTTANGCTAATYASLTSARGLAIAADGASVYVASTNSGNGTITHLDRNSATGTLTWASCVSNNGSIAGCTDPTFDSLGEASDVAISPDGTSVYSTSYSGSAVTTFGRDTSTGALTQLGCVANGGANGCATPTFATLTNPKGVQVSPDGSNVYVGSQQSITTFARNSATGVLTQIGCVSAASISGCTASANSLMIFLTGLTVAADGSSVYATDSFSYGNSINVFSREAAGPVPSGTTGSNAALPEFTFSLPDGRECTSISPQVVVLGSRVSLPSADALCGVDGSVVTGWLIPGQTNAFEVGRSLVVTGSQQFTAVLELPWVNVIFDANVGADDACMRDGVDVPGDERDSVWSVPREEVTDQPLPSTAICTPEGYELSGWVDRRTDPWTVLSTDDRIPGAAVDDDGNAANEVHLYAQWSRV